MNNDFFTLPEVSKYLKIPKSTIYKLTQQNKIPSCKIGKQLRFKKSSIDRWAVAKEKTAAIDNVQHPLVSIDNAPKFADKRILIVDDDKIVLKTISKLLAQQGYEVVTADTGEEAIKKVQDNLFDLILVDVRMPTPDGIETIKRIRSLCHKDKKPIIPEIVITGYADPAAEREAMELGITDFIYKPFLISDFLKAVEKKLGE